MNQEASSPSLLPTTELPSAPLWRRMGCWFYEGLLLFGVIFIAGYLFGTLTQTRHAMNNRHGLQAFVFLILAIYFTFFWHKGQTLAMKTWHLKIVNTHSQSLSQMQALVRYAYAWIWFVPPLAMTEVLGWSSLDGLVVWMAWTLVWALLSKLHPDKQFWHDHWAHSRVVDTRQDKALTSATIQS